MKSKTTILRFAAACLLATITASLAPAFEGKIEMKTTSSHGEGEMPMTYFVKGTNLRMESTTPPDKKHKNGGTFAMIINMESRESIMLMSEEKMYMVHKISESTAEKAESKAAEMDFKPTGRKENIAGIEAEEFAGISEKKRTEIWVTKELGKFMMANQGKGGPMGGKKSAQSSAWQKFAEQGNFFPLRTIQRAKEGAPEDFRQEVTKVEKSSLPDSLFQPPADYKKFEMPSMSDMMKGMIPGGSN